MVTSLISTIGELSPVVQSLIVIGLFTLLIVAACSRKAAINLVSFLGDLGHLVAKRAYQQPSLPGNDRKRGAMVLSQKNREAQAHFMSTANELGGDHQGAKAHEQHLNT